MDCHPLLQRSSQPRGWTQASRNAGGIFNIWATREALMKQGTLRCMYLYKVWFSLGIYPGDFSFLKDTDKQLPRKRHIGQSQRKCETWNFGFLFPGCHGQLCVPSTDVPAVSTCRWASLLQALCPEILLGLHRQGMTEVPYSWSQPQTSLEVQLILHDKTPILNHIILVAQTFYSKSCYWHPCRAGPRSSQKQMHFSQY